MPVEEQHIGLRTVPRGRNTGPRRWRGRGVKPADPQLQIRNAVGPLPGVGDETALRQFGQHGDLLAVHHTGAPRGEHLLVDAVSVVPLPLRVLPFHRGAADDFVGDVTVGAVLGAGVGRGLGDADGTGHGADPVVVTPYVARMVLIRRKTILEVVGIHRESIADLLEVVLAVCRTGAFAGLIQCRQQQSGQDGDDRNHYEKFD